ncbi:MAG: PEP-CTERM sorting domain-containing protein [Candidatus Omnitrophica bacterium]|nr:PEP-CTERM sorting domain-containing protein [Candidatus Omnitrophota bacterium]
MKVLILIALTVGIMCTSGQAAEALMIPEVEPNDSFADAMNLDPYFSVGANSDIVDSATVPWVSVSGTGNDTYDYYSFTVPFAGSQGIFEIDYGYGVGGSIDPILLLYASPYNQLDGDDDSNPAWGAGGSTSWLDSYLPHGGGWYTFHSPGLYYLRVSEWSRGPVRPGGTYTLQASVSGHSTDTVIPEPATLLLLGSGLLGVGGFKLRRRKTA